MPTTHIKEAIERTSEQLTEHPDSGRGTYTAEATRDHGLRIRVEGPHESVIVSDVSKGIGGDESAPSPGSLARAALASCDATGVAVWAAHEGIELSSLEVVVEWDYDARGMLGVDDHVPAGPQGVRVHYRVGADGVSDQRLEDLVEVAEARSPVGDAFRRPLDYETDIEIV